MNRRAIGIAFLAAMLAMHTLASSAWAECAWLLWMHIKLRMPGVRPADEWRRESVEDTRAACLVSMNDEFDRFVVAYKRGGATVVHSLDEIPKGQSRPPHLVTVGRQQLTSYNGDSFSEASFECLPDTVDPRGPKGSGR